MKTAAVVFLVVLVLSTASGCTALLAGSAVANRVADRIDSAVDRYCETDERTRATIRDRVAETVDPNRVVVECAGDNDG